MSFPLKGRAPGAARKADGITKILIDGAVRAASVFCMKFAASVSLVGLMVLGGSISSLRAEDPASEKIDVSRGLARFKGCSTPIYKGVPSVEASTFMAEESASDPAGLAVRFEYKVTYGPKAQSMGDKDKDKETEDARLTPALESLVGFYMHREICGVLINTNKGAGLPGSAELSGTYQGKVVKIVILPAGLFGSGSLLVTITSIDPSKKK